MKAMFEIGPFKTIMDIPNHYWDYYFAITEMNDELTWRGYKDIESMYEDCQPTIIKKLRFIRHGWETLQIDTNILHMPRYIFERIID